MRFLLFLLFPLSAFPITYDTVTIHPITGDYVSFASFLQTYGTLDLVSGDRQVTAIAVGDWSSDSCTYSDAGAWTCDKTRFVKLTADAANYAGPTWDASKFYFAANGGTILPLDDDGLDYLLIEGLQIHDQYTGGNSKYFMEVSSTTSFRDCYVRSNDAGTGTFYRCIAWAAITDTVYVENCVFDGWGTTNDAVLYQTQTTGGLGLVQNCTFANANLGTNTSNAGMRIVNCLFKNCTNNTTSEAYADSTSYNTTDLGSFEYTVSLGGGNDNTSATITFVGSNNYHLAARTHHDGWDRSDFYTTDMDGQTIVPPYPRGVDYIGAAGAANYRRRRMLLR